MRRLTILAVGAALLGGCATGDISDSTSDQVRQEFSEANYEKAMKAAGRGAELEAEKQKAAQRGEQ